MKNFAAIDFETANNERSSVCSVGIVIVKNGEIADSFFPSSFPSRTITIIGAARCMVSDTTTRITPRYSRKFGNR